MRRGIIAVGIVTLLVATACGDPGEPESGRTSNSWSWTPTPTPFDVAKALDEFVRSSPVNLAQEFRVAGAAYVTAEDVEAVADELCQSLFSPRVAFGFLRRYTASTSFLFRSPMNRLARLAARSANCAIPYGARRTDGYVAAIDREFPPFTSPLKVAPPLTGLPEILCNVFELPVADVPDEVLKVVSRGRLEGGFALSIAVDIAGQSCPQWMPKARDALAEFLDRD